MFERVRLFIACLTTMALFCSGCDVIYRFLDKEGAEEKALVGEVVPFESNPTVEEVQMLLQLYGYSPGPVDGSLGRRTRDAIEKFQRENGLKETRFVDQETWRKLRLFKENGFIEEDSLNVSLVQQALLNAGMDVGKVDGKFGPKTKKAVEEFQKTLGLKVDGKVGYQTLTRLLQYLQAAESTNVN